MSRHWKEVNTRNKHLSLGANTSLNVSDITTNNNIQDKKFQAIEFAGNGIIAGLDSNNSIVGKQIVTGYTTKQYFEENFEEGGTNRKLQWYIGNDGDISYIYPGENVKITSFTPGGKLHFLSDVSFDGSIVASDASFGNIAGLNGGPVNLHDAVFSGTIGTADGVSALEVTTDLSVNGSFRKADASFARVGELSSGSKVVFVSDVSFDGSIVASDASFGTIGGLNGGPVNLHDAVFSGTIGTADGVSALEVTTDLSVNGSFRAADASFARVGELSSGSKVVFVSDVSFDRSIVASDASFSGVVEIHSLSGNAIISQISIDTAVHDKVPSSYAVREYVTGFDVSAFFDNQTGTLRPKLVSYGNRIGANTSSGGSLIFVDDVSFNGCIKATDASFTTISSSTSNTPIVVADDISFQRSIQANDASFENVDVKAIYVDNINTSLTSIPIGGIILFYGDLHTDGVTPLKDGVIYTNWHICNGSNETPNLSDKFVRGTTTANHVGTIGGSDTDNLGNFLPPHTHNVTTRYQVHNYPREWRGGITHGNQTAYTQTYTTLTTGSGDYFSVVPNYTYLMYIMRKS